MIRISLLLVFLSIFNAGAQIQLENKSLSQPDLEILYSGRQNSIHLLSENPLHTYSITSTASVITKKSENTYSFYPAYHLAIDTIRIHDGAVLVKEFHFRVLNMPINSIQLANLTPIQKKASKNELLAHPRISLVQNSLYLSEEKIQSFDFKLYSPTAPDSLVFESIDSPGTAFTTDQIAALSTAKSGDRLEISRIVVIDDKGVKYVYRGLYVIIE